MDPILLQTIHETDALVEGKLRNIINSRSMPLYDIMAYHMGWEDDTNNYNLARTNSWLHGTLCLLSCQVMGGEMNSAIPAAAAVELVDSFCQIHDDVESGNPNRNNRDSVWWVWGPAQAINAGDGLHALARLAMFGLSEHGISRQLILKAIQLLDRASLQACEGRFTDLEAQERLDITKEAYLSTAAMRIGSLLGCSMALGGLVASAPPGILAKLQKVGETLGVAMAIKEDIRKLWFASEYPEQYSPDVLNKKKLLPIILATSNSPITIKRQLGDIYFKRVLEKTDIERLLDILQKTDARSDSEEILSCYRSKISSELELLFGKSNPCTLLTKYVDYLLD